MRMINGLGIISMVFMSISCNSNPTQIVFSHKYNNKKDIYTFKISNNSSHNLFIIPPNIYIKMENCDDTILILSSLFEDESKCLGLKSERASIFNMLQATNPWYTKCQELSETLGKKWDNMILSQCDTLNRYGQFVFIRQNSSVEYNFINNEILQPGNYKIFWHYPMFFLDSKKIKIFINDLKKIKLSENFEYADFNLVHDTGISFVFKNNN